MWGFEKHCINNRPCLNRALSTEADGCPYYETHGRVSPCECLSESLGGCNWFWICCETKGYTCICSYQAFLSYLQPPLKYQKHVFLSSSSGNISGTVGKCKRSFTQLSISERSMKEDRRKECVFSPSEIFHLLAELVLYLKRDHLR